MTTSSGVTLLALLALWSSSFRAGEPIDALDLLHVQVFSKHSIHARQSDDQRSVAAGRVPEAGFVRASQSLDLFASRLAGPPATSRIDVVPHVDGQRGFRAQATSTPSVVDLDGSEHP